MVDRMTACSLTSWRRNTGTPEMRDSATLPDHIMTLFATKMKIEVPTVDTDLFEAGVLDSFGLVDLLLHLETEFGAKTSVEDLEIDNFRSIAKIAEWVAPRRQDAPREG